MNSKYNAKKVIVDGIKFDSKMESDFYKILLDTKVKFSLQPEFILQHKFEKNGKKHLPIVYKGDFMVGDIVYDVKGMETQTFIIKRKLFDFQYKDLKLICITKCPIKYLEHALIKGMVDGKEIGFIENDKLKKIRKDSKLNIEK